MDECWLENIFGFWFVLFVFVFVFPTDRSDDVKKEWVVSLYILASDCGTWTKVPFILGIRSSGGQNIFQDIAGKQKQTLSEWWCFLTKSGRADPPSTVSFLTTLATKPYPKKIIHNRCRCDERREMILSDNNYKSWRKICRYPHCNSLPNWHSSETVQRTILPSPSTASIV